jgi:uncharacterized membrane protein YdfJ with MMPL/SSD domain
MDNRGFGFIFIFIFAIIAVAAVFMLYTFITSIMLYFPKGHIPNYTNEYRKYFTSNTNQNVILVSNNNIEKTEYNSYSEIEKAVRTATRKYVADFYSTINDRDPLYIKISVLKTNGYIDIIKDINDSSIDCTGYTRVEKVNEDTAYDTYIKCGYNYTTADYVDRLDG